MTAPRTVDLKRRIANSSTSLDSRLEAVTERIDQVDNESSGHFVQMKEFIFDGFQTAQTELTKGLAGVRAEMTDGLAGVRAEMTEGLAGVRAGMTEGLAGVRAEMTEGLAGVRTEMTEGLAGVRAEMTPRLDRIEGKIDRLLTNRQTRLRRPKRGR